MKTAVFHDTLLVLAEAVRQMDYNSIMGSTDVSCDEEKVVVRIADRFIYAIIVFSKGAAESPFF